MYPIAESTGYFTGEQGIAPNEDQVTAQKKQAGMQLSFCTRYHGLLQKSFHQHDNSQDHKDRTVNKTENLTGSADFDLIFILFHGGPP
jgi:hypothetical protein